MAITLSNHPARLAAIAAGEKSFLAVGFPCKADPKHVWRYTEHKGCCECNRQKGTAKVQARAEARGTIVREPLPTIGEDFDAGKTARRLIDASDKFLTLLHREALNTVRNESPR